jgi:N-acetylglucosaminyl-diphospho-decaprenol L-rhamnosyltransferase
MTSARRGMPPVAGRLEVAATRVSAEARRQCIIVQPVIERLQDRIGLGRQFGNPSEDVFGGRGIDEHRRGLLVHDDVGDPLATSCADLSSQQVTSTHGEVRLIPGPASCLMGEAGGQWQRFSSQRYGTVVFDQPEQHNPETGTIDLSVVVVTWNSAALLPACLESLLADAERAGLSTEVVVVDNASGDDTRAVARDFPQVQLVELEENRGFAVATNIGLRRARGRAALLLNPDTELRPGALAALWRALWAMPHVGLVGPLLLNPDGSPQSAGYRFPGLAQQLLDFFPLHPRLAGSRLNGRFDVGDGLTPFAVDHPLGACMLVRRAALEEVGLLDEGYFMYSEEIDWCRRFKAAGWTVLITPAAHIVHHGGQSTRQAAPAMFIELHRSRARYFARHDRRVLRPSGWLAHAAALRAPERRAALRQAARLYGDAAERRSNA